MKEAVDRQASASLPTSEKSVYVELDFDEEPQLEYVRYGIEMKMETHKAIRSQHKNYWRDKNNNKNDGLKIYNDVKPKI